MNTEALFWLALVGIPLVLLIRHVQHVKRYPLRENCRKCHGAATITDTDWRGRAVKGTCPRCGGVDSWIERRRSER